MNSTPSMQDQHTSDEESKQGGSGGEPLPAAIAAALGSRITEGAVVDGVVHITVPATEVIEALRILAFEMDEPYSHLSDLCGVDRPDCIEVVYHLFRPLSNDACVVRVKLPRTNPHVPTATVLWETANWAEREAAEMYGITFEGHPDPRRLLLPDDISGYPLRKDWEYPQDHPYLRREPLHEEFPEIVGRVRAEAAPAEDERDGNSK